ncbi:MAG: MBL fold metallo-hydrolase [Treponema sp.]|nr:MBL fold metallo-hydrolase [Treponema sp.]
MKKEMIFGVLLSVMTVGTFAQENNKVFSCKVGTFEVFMFVESQRKGNAGILVGADEATLKRHIPVFGFFHSTNMFLIKGNGQNILIDTAFGGAAFESMKALGVEPDQIDAVLITHLHGDHIGGLVKDGQAVFPKAAIYLSRLEHDHFTKTNPNQGAVAALAAYGSRVQTFEPGELGGNLTELLPGITPIANYGHTPGHTVFLVENNGEKFLIIGDLLHVAVVQFPVPDISATYDMDQKTAATVRRQILDYAAKNKILIGGMHIVYPGTGMVEADGSGFKFVPSK